MKTVVNIAAYKFAALDDLKQRREQLLELCHHLALKGTILLSNEGINLFISGSRRAIDELLLELRREPKLSDLYAKESFSDHQSFSRMLVKIKREIIAFGVDGIDPQKETSPRVSPQQLKHWLDEGEPVVLLDVRNDAEYAIGTFDDAIAIGIDSFRNFPRAISALPEKIKRQKVVTFCTGGIRCEKAGPLLENQGFTNVYQLDGGILNYFEQCGGDHYHGECFVFDKRVALDSSLNETDTTQCYKCQAALTVDDQQSSKFAIGVSCPYCYKSKEQRASALLAKRQAAILQVTNPLPGSIPYENHRPIKVTGRYEGYKAIDFLAAIQTRLSRLDWLQICMSGQLLLEDRAIEADEVLRAGQRLLHVIPGTIEPDVNVDIRVLYEDDALVVIDKPAPLPMHPCGRFNRNTLSWMLNEVYQPLGLRIAHRLDANTSGVVVFSKTRQVAAPLQQQFESGQVSKSYVARILGRPNTDQFSSSVPIDGQPGQAGARLPHPKGLSAHTVFSVMQGFSDGTTLVEARPLTGRTNQIRVHLWDLGLPILGDPLYLPNKKIGQSQTLALADPPMCLHAKRIEFEHPTTGQAVSYEAVVPSWSIA